MKYVLVTGAGGGMGRAVVRMLRDAGYVVFALDVTATATDERVIPLVADITDEESLRKAFGAVCAATNTLYAIVHFAGVYVLDSLAEISEEIFIRAFQVNVFGAYRVNRIFMPLLKKGSRIILTTSELAPLDPLPFTGLYAVTKSALDKYAYSMRMELQLLGISVVVLRPGAVKTGMLRASTDALEQFSKTTHLYACNAERFRRIVEHVEARHIPPEVVARKVRRILGRRYVRYVYNLNRNPLLLLLNMLPHRLQTWIIGIILK